METKKKTDRIKRDAEIDSLLDDGEDFLNELLNNVDHKHKNGGIFEDVKHHTQVMQDFTEEELDATASSGTEETKT